MGPSSEAANFGCRVPESVTSSVKGHLEQSDTPSSHRQDFGARICARPRNTQETSRWRAKNIVSRFTPTFGPGLIRRERRTTCHVDSSTKAHQKDLRREYTLQKIVATRPRRMFESTTSGLFGCCPPKNPFLLTVISGFGHVERQAKRRTRPFRHV